MAINSYNRQVYTGALLVEGADLNLFVKQSTLQQVAFQTTMGQDVEDLSTITRFGFTKDQINALQD